jgi:hypothetical protein
VTEPSQADRSLCAATSHLLDATARSAGALGCLCGLLAAVLLLQRTAVPIAAALVLALVPMERVLALRLHFDAGLFKDLARGAASPLLALDALDGALQALRLRAPAAVSRSLLDRVDGARRLVFWHGAVAAAQLAGVLVALALGQHGAA